MGTPAQRLESERTKYPAMNVDEVLVWREFLRLHQTEFDRFDYNTRIGSGTDPGPEFSENIRKMAVALSQLRLDAVGFRGEAATIFEVKRNAGPQNVGQLLTYNAVWTRAKMSPVPPSLVLVCADFTPNILPVIADTGIRLEKLSVDFSVLAPQRLSR